MKRIYEFLTEEQEIITVRSDNDINLIQSKLDTLGIKVFSYTELNPEDLTPEEVDYEFI